jgi:hypothetical protein
MPFVLHLFSLFRNILPADYVENTTTADSSDLELEELIKNRKIETNESAGTGAQSGVCGHERRITRCLRRFC